MGQGGIAEQVRTGEGPDRAPGTPIFKSPGRRKHQGEKLKGREMGRKPGNLDATEAKGGMRFKEGVANRVRSLKGLER